MPRTRNLEQFLRQEELSSHTVKNYEGPGYISDDKRKPIHTIHRIFQLVDCSGSRPAPAARAQSIPAAINPENKSYPHISEYISPPPAQEAGLKHSRHSLQATQEAVKNVLLSLTITGTANLESGLKNAFYKFLQTVLNGMAEKKDGQSI